MDNPARCIREVAITAIGAVPRESIETHFERV